MGSLESQIVRRGLSFPNCFATTSLCCPSRASILRSQYVHHHGVTNTSLRQAIAIEQGNFLDAFNGKALVPLVRDSLVMRRAASLRGVPTRGARRVVQTLGRTVREAEDGEQGLAMFSAIAHERSALRARRAGVAFGLTSGHRSTGRIQTRLTSGVSRLIDSSTDSSHYASQPHGVVVSIAWCGGNLSP